MLHYTINNTINNNFSYYFTDKQVKCKILNTEYMYVNYLICVSLYQSSLTYIISSATVEALSTHFVFHISQLSPLCFE